MQIQGLEKPEENTILKKGLHLLAFHKSLESTCCSGKMEIEITMAD